MARVEQILRRLLAVAALVLAHGMIVIFAGHGIGLVALLMVFGSSSAWLSSQFPGWVGWAVLLSTLPAWSEYALVSLRFWGAGLLVLSAAAFVAHSAVVPSALTALPLLALWVYWLNRYVASSRARVRPGRPWPVTLAVIALGITLAYGAVSLAPAFRGDSMDWREMVAVMELLTMAVLALLTWEGTSWARWGIAALIVSPWIIYTQELIETVRRAGIEASVTVALLALDVVTLALLFSRPASRWLGSSARATR